MGLVKGFRIISGLIFLLFLFACDGERRPPDQLVQEEESSAPAQGTEFTYSDLGFADPDFRFSQITSREDFGFYSFVDTFTFRFAEPPGKEAYQLTKEDIKAIYAWRSPKGVPWTAWANDPDPSFVSHEAFNVRATRSAYVIPEEALKKVVRFLVREQGLEPREEIIAFFFGGGQDPDSLEDVHPATLFYQVAGWFRDNVSASSFDVHTGIMETYAWYKSPFYKTGTLPSELEEAMEIISEGRVYGEEESSFPELQAVAERAAEAIRTDQMPGLDGPYYSSPSDLGFLQMDQNLGSLPFYRKLLGVLKGLENNPGNLADHLVKLNGVLKTYPGENSYYLVNWARRIEKGLILLVENKGQPENYVLETETFGELTVGMLKDLTFGDVEWLARDIEAFIRQWSELQSIS